MARGTKQKDSAPIINGTGVHNNRKNKNHNEQQKKELEKADRKKLVLWKKPLVTMEYFFREIFVLLTTYGKR